MNVQALNLRICGAGRHHATFDDMRKVVLPEATPTYTPVSHLQFRGLVHEALTDRGFDIVTETHTLTNDGKQHFGLVQVFRQDLHREGTGFVVSMRNSYNKSLAAMIGAGNAPFVCTNLIFNCEHSCKRRHSANVLENLYASLGGLVDLMIAGWVKQGEREDLYRTIDVTPIEFDRIAVELARREAIPPRTIFDVTEEFRKPRHDFGGDTLYGGLQAVTEVLKGTALNALPQRSAALLAALDEIAGAPKVLPFHGFGD